MKLSLFNRSALLGIACAGLYLGAATVATADGMPEEVRKHRAVRPAAPAPAPVEAAPMEQPRPVVDTTIEDSCEWKVRLSPGVAVWFFKDEGNLPGASMALDVWRTDYPINFHVGVEGRHMYLTQESAQFAREWDDKTTRVTFIRIPFALEYMQPVAENTTWYIGAGPDILHTANDIVETNVGVHVSTRLHYAFDEHWGAAIEAGYMWGSIDGQDEDVVLDNAFVNPTLAYTF
ncbi:MAG: porin family protein [Oligoflexia bacterium]|nr:porin family protein [Oligoflexia bacterium]